MTTDKTPDISDKLAALQRRYYEQLPDKIHQMESAWQNYNADSHDQNLLEDLYRQAHTLMGTAGTFGAVNLSRAAKELDAFLKLVNENKTVPSEDEINVISRIIYHIKEQAEMAIHGTQLQNQDLHWQNYQIQKHADNNLIYIVDDDQLVLERLAAELDIIDFDVKTFTSIDEFFTACENQMPAVIIMDIVFPDETDNGIQVIKKLKEKYTVLPPIIFISVQASIDTRLAAMRTGASRFFEKPLNYKKLRATVEGLSARNPLDTYRVLIVDDSVVMSEYYATILNQVGIDTQVVNYPLTVLDTLQTYKPDLILMDLYMPECSGIELASVIRQDDDYVHTSIVFLSAEKDIDVQLNAIDVGADDFLTKPAKPEQLIATVVARVKRTRWLNRIHNDLNNALRDNQYQKVAMDMHSIVSESDASGLITYVNDKFVEVSGYSRKELIGKNHRIVKSNHHSKSFYKDIWQTIISGKIWSGEIKNRKKNGEDYWVESTIIPFLDDSGLPYKYVSIRTDITPMMKIQEDLFDAKERAEAANRAKTEFLSSMSHELRTPLNAILGFSQILLMDELTDIQQDNLREITKAGNHLLVLINEVLDLARIEADRLSISMQPVNLLEVIIDCQNLIEPLVREKKIQFTFNCSCSEHEAMIVSADHTRLKQVILNLLSNAIKYNHQGGSVKLYCQQNGDKFRLYVEDNGIGISNENMSLLFKPFSRLAEHTYGAEGTGIGLVITRRMIELMGGSIGVDSEEGKGSRFWIELNLDKYATTENHSDEEIKPVLDVVTDETTKNRKVLYVEDNPVNMLLIEKLINKTEGFEIIKAFTPEEGIEQARKHKIDLFLLDINLPGMSGHELLHYFRNQEDTRDIKAIALSANAMVDDIKQGKESGFDDYITKPIVIDEFISKLKSIFD